MKNPKLIIAFAVVFSLGVVATAQSNTFITGSQVKDETLSGSDLGTDVTRVKTAGVTVRPGDDTWECTDPNNDATCEQVQGSGAGVVTRTVTCATGNVTGGGVKLLDTTDGYNLEVYASYPATDKSWTFSLYNTGPYDIPVQLRVICI